MAKSGAKASPAPPSHSRDSWPVLVYRLRSGCAWEVFAGEESTASKGKPTKSGDEDELTASPKKGCIEVRKMRLRVRLFDAASKSSDVAKQRDLDGWHDDALVVRRKNTVLITTRRGMGAICLQFRTPSDCVGFCDRLVELNKDHFARQTLLGRGSKRIGEDEDDDGRVSGMVRREMVVHETNDIKRRKMQVLGDQVAISQRFDKALVRDEAAPDDCSVHAKLLQEKQIRRRDDLMAYITKLSQDEDFKGYVDEIERSLDLEGDCGDNCYK